MKYAAKTDGNQKKVVADLRKLGFAVCVTSSIGRGFPDLIISLPREIWLAEVKDECGGLNDRQAEFHTKWQADGGKPILVIRSAEDFVRQIHRMAA